MKCSCCGRPTASSTGGCRRNSTGNASKSRLSGWLKRAIMAAVFVVLSFAVMIAAAVFL